MSSDSPMMHRVQRPRKKRRFPSFPRKGRIRFVLALLLIVGLYKFGPALVQKISLPSSNDKQVTSASLLSQPTSLKKTTPDLKLSIKDIRILLSQHPSLYTRKRQYLLKDNDSLLVYTSIDTTLQKYMAKLMRRYRPLYGALIALNPSTGRVLTVVSYSNDSMPSLDGNLCFRSLFPSASVFKTVTAAAAIEFAGYTSRCMVEHKGRSHTLYQSQIARELAWSVDLTFAQSYARSINAVFARIGMYEIGTNKLLDISTKMGFNVPFPGEIPCDKSVVFTPVTTFNLAELASGFNQATTISPLHGALIAATITENGAAPIPTLIDSVKNVKIDSTVYNRTTNQWIQAIQPSTAKEIQTMMHTVVKRGTAHKQFRYIRNSPRFEAYHYGGKTGSVDKDNIGRVDWFVGYAKHPHYTDERIAVGVVTVHGAYWTVHSSYLAAEAFRKYLRTEQKKRERLERKNDSLIVSATDIN
jgi:cell division protein FtsI/penicillin-binding protein 2